MPWLTDNIVSVFKNVYGLAGDQVKVVADHDNVMIVEGQDGQRFSVSRDKLTFEKQKIERKPVVIERNIRPTKAGSKKQSTITQKSLFLKK